MAPRPGQPGKERGGSGMKAKRVGILFGMEDNFPWALMEAIGHRSEGRVEATKVEVGEIRDEPVTDYDLIVDRISHDVPFYRTFVKCAAASGTTVINNPFWWSADDKFIDNLIAKAAGVAVPKTFLLPHKEHPANTQATSFRNLRFVNWDDMFRELGFPIYLKDANGGGWRDVYKCENEEEFFAAYDRTRDLCMMAQESIDFTEYFRCYVIGRKHVRIMPYDPRKPFHERYVRNTTSSDSPLWKKVERDAIALCEALGYDMNTVELAVRDGIPYAIDFMNPAPDADPFSVGDDNYRWVIETTADVVIDKALNPPPFEATGSWPSLMRPSRTRQAGSGTKKTTRGSGSKKPAPRKRSK